MDLGLKDRVAIVAASSQGSGEGRRLRTGAGGREAGAVRAYRTSAFRDGRGDPARNRRFESMARALDVTNYEQVRAFVAAASQEYGRLDICIANAGGPPSKRSPKLPLRTGTPPPISI